MEVKIIPFRPEDQEAVRRLILEGLKEHWGILDENKNHDLNNISMSYAKDIFLVAWKNDKIVGTGAFLPRSEDTVEVVRMSVQRYLRRRGIGGRILTELCKRAYRRGYKRLILETTET